MIALYLPLATVVVTLVVSGPISEAVHDVRVAFQRPCLEVTGLVDPLLSVVESKLNASPVPPYSYVGDLRLDYDQEGGSLYVYDLTVTNNGNGPAMDLRIRLNLPGVPLLTYSTRNETDVEAEHIYGRIGEFGHAGGSVRISGELEQSWREPSLSGFSIDPRILKEPRPVFNLQNNTHGINGHRYYIPTFFRQWFSYVVEAHGSPWVTYRLPVLPPGVSWSLKTFYFGYRTNLDAGGDLSAAAMGYNNILQYQSRSLNAFDPTGRPSEAHYYGALPWNDHVQPICRWPLEA
jgi:hypothetical protein